MASKIDVSKIDEFFPKAGINQSSQGFRNNFGEIKRNMLQAKTEISKIGDTKVAVLGDATGTSATAIGDVGDLNIQLTLSNSGVTAGSYTNRTQNLTLTVDSKGRITSMVAVNKPVIDPTKRSALPVDLKYDGSTATRALRIPKIIIDDVGTVVDIDVAEVGNFSALGQPLDPGSFWIGSNSRQAVQHTPPFSVAQNSTDFWALCMTPYSSDLLGWRKLPIAASTRVVSGKYTTASLSGTDYAIDFDMTKMDLMADATGFNNEDTFIIYSSRNSAPYRVKWSRLNTAVSGLKALLNDGTPALGGDMDTRGFYLNSSTTTGLRLGKSTTPVYIADSLWPVPTGQPVGAALSVGPSGLVWSVPTGTASSGPTYSQGDGILIASGQGGATTLNVSLLKFTPVQAALSTDFVALVQPDGVQKRTTVSSLFSATSSNLGANVAVVSLGGNDSTGVGSWERPYRTITRAVAASYRPNNPAGDIFNIMLMPGVYSESVVINQPRVALHGVGSASETVLQGVLTVNPSQVITRLHNLTVDIRNQGADPYDTSFFAMRVDNGCDELIASNCRFMRSVTVDGALLQTVVNLNGAQSGRVRFNNCEFVGLVNNALTPTGPYDTVNIQGVNNTTVTAMGVRSANGRTVLRSVNYVTDVIHDSGSLELHDVSHLVGNSSRQIVSTSNSGVLVITNSIMVGVGLDGSIVQATINKTGTCDYMLANVVRKGTSDVLTGNSLI